MAAPPTKKVNTVPNRDSMDLDFCTDALKSFGIEGSSDSPSPETKGRIGSNNRSNDKEMPPERQSSTDQPTNTTPRTLLASPPKNPNYKKPSGHNSGKEKPDAPKAPQSTVDQSSATQTYYLKGSDTISTDAKTPLKLSHPLSKAGAQQIASEPARRSARIATVAMNNNQVKPVNTAVDSSHKVSDQAQAHMHKETIQSVQRTRKRKHASVESDSESESKLGLTQPLSSEEMREQHKDRCAPLTGPESRDTPGPKEVETLKERTPPEQTSITTSGMPLIEETHGDQSQALVKATLPSQGSLSTDKAEVTPSSLTRRQASPGCSAPNADIHQGKRVKIRSTRVTSAPPRTTADPIGEGGRETSHFHSVQARDMIVDPLPMQMQALTLGHRFALPAHPEPGRHELAVYHSADLPLMAMIEQQRAERAARIIHANELRLESQRRDREAQLQLQEDEEVD